MVNVREALAELFLEETVEGFKDRADMIGGKVT